MGRSAPGNFDDVFLVKLKTLICSSLDKSRTPVLEPEGEDSNDPPLTMSVPHSFETFVTALDPSDKLVTTLLDVLVKEVTTRHERKVHASKHLLDLDTVPVIHDASAVALNGILSAARVIDAQHPRRASARRAHRPQGWAGSLLRESYDDWPTLNHGEPTVTVIPGSVPAAAEHDTEFHSPLFDAYSAEDPPAPFGSTWTSRFGMSPPPTISYPLRRREYVHNLSNHRGDWDWGVSSSRSADIDPSPIPPTEPGSVARSRIRSARHRRSSGSVPIPPPGPLSMSGGDMGENNSSLEFAAHSARRRSSARDLRAEDPGYRYSPDPNVVSDDGDTNETNGALLSRRSAPTLLDRHAERHSNSSLAMAVRRRRMNASVARAETSSDEASSVDFLSFFRQSQTGEAASSTAGPVASGPSEEWPSAAPRLRNGAYDPVRDVMSPSTIDQLRTRLEAYPHRGSRNPNLAVNHSGLRPSHSALLLTQGGTHEGISSMAAGVPVPILSRESVGYTNPREVIHPYHRRMRSHSPPTPTTLETRRRIRDGTGTPDPYAERRRRFDLEVTNAASTLVGRSASLPYPPSPGSSSSASPPIVTPDEADSADDSQLGFMRRRHHASSRPYAGAYVHRSPSPMLPGSASRYHFEDNDFLGTGETSSRAHAADDDRDLSLPPPVVQLIQARARSLSPEMA